METVYVVGGVIALAIICLTIIIGLAIKYMPKQTNVYDYLKSDPPKPPMYNMTRSYTPEEAAIEVKRQQQAYEKRRNNE